jgi:hypothetical protein
MKRSKTVAHARNNKVAEWIIDLAGIACVAACMSVLSVVRVLTLID